LEAAKAKLRELVSEVLHDRPPTPTLNPDRSEGSGPGP
jgi:hypothetical protein